MTAVEEQPIRTASPGASANLETRLYSLDGLRGMAILLVIGFHTLRVTGHEGSIGRFLVAVQDSGWIGVDLFFVLSGFLITGILLDSKTRPGYFLNFFARRTLRIFPLYYAVLTVSLVVVPAALGFNRLPGLYPRLLANQLWLWTYTANYLQATGAHTLPGFGHFWSLAIEEQFYWIWPVIVYLFSRRRLMILCATICALLPFVRWAMQLAGENNWGIRQYTFTRMDTLLFGAMAAIAVREMSWVTRYRRILIGLLGLAALSLITIAANSGYLPYESNATVVFGYSCLAILFAGLVYDLATNTESRISFLLSKPLLRWFGTYSYGIYVFHWPIAQAYKAALEPRLARLAGAAFSPMLFAFIFVAGTSSVMAYLSWVFLEARFIKLKRHFVTSEKADLLQPRRVRIEGAELAIPQEL